VADVAANAENYFNKIMPIDLFYTMKKYYTIRITQPGKTNVWHYNKVGRIYERCTLANGGPTNGPVFYVNPCQCINHLFCEVISETIVEKYTKG
jgi:hypothetical protein